MGREEEGRVSRGLMSPPPKIISVPAAGAGSQLERWKSEDAFHQALGGLPRPPTFVGGKQVDRKNHRDIYSRPSLPPAAS